MVCDNGKGKGNFSIWVVGGRGCVLFVVGGLGR